MASSSSSSNKLTVIGIGRIGLCFSLSCERAGYNVLGVDLSPVYCEALNARTFVSDEPGVTDLLQSCTNFHATTSLAEGLEFADTVFVLVDTPTAGGERQYDHSKVSRVLSQINRRKPADKHIVISCTVMPGYIRNVARFLLRDCPNVTVNYNPAFVAQGDILKGYQTGGYFSMVLVGADNDASAARLTEIYTALARGSTSPPAICRMTPESAEITKLASNCFRTIKISFANMIGDIADRTPGADKDEISRALGCDDSIGPKCIRPGYAYGGPCYPRDNVALGVYASSIGVKPLLPEASDQYNDFHSDLMFHDLLAEDRDEYRFEDVTYKPNCAVPMIDNSPKLRIAKKLAKAGKRVVVCDHAAVLDAVMQEFGDMFVYEERK